MVHILLLVTGSVAATTLAELTKELEKKIPRAILKVVLSHHAAYFTNHHRQILSTAITTPENWMDQMYYTDADEFPKDYAYKRGDKVLHVELGKWADIILVAPASANTIAKIAGGLCDNLLVSFLPCQTGRASSLSICYILTMRLQTCIIRAWTIGKPLYYAPAMNTQMWLHPITAQQLSALESFGYNIIQPIEKVLACGDKGTPTVSVASRLADYVLLSRHWCDGGCSSHC